VVGIDSGHFSFEYERRKTAEIAWNGVYLHEICGFILQFAGNSFFSIEQIA
jgi:hypothetical protein